MRNSDKVSDARRALVLDAAAKLGYRPNAIARSLASHRSNTVGILLNDLHNPFYAEIAEGIEEQASEVAHRLLIITGGRARQRELAMLEALLEYRTDGLILVSPRMPGPRIADVVGSLPCVVVGLKVRDPRFDCVLTDDTVGTQLAVDHLVQLGHEAIVHVDGGNGASSAPRRNGYLQAMTQGGPRRPCDRRRVRRAGGRAGGRAVAASQDAPDRGRHRERPQRGRPDRPARGRAGRGSPRTSA